MTAISDPVETVAHVIQIALTPVFLFSGIATLLGVISTRLGRVADHVDALTERIDAAERAELQRLQRRLVYLRRRARFLDVAVILGALGGMSTLVAAGLLFVDGLRERAGATLFFAFGAALLLAVGALGGFLAEMMLASGGIRDEAASGAREAAAEDASEVLRPRAASPAEGR